MAGQLPEKDVDTGEPFPVLPALWALVLFGRCPPQGQAVPAEAVPAVQGGRVDQNIIAAVATELAHRDLPAEHGSSGDRHVPLLHSTWQFSTVRHILS